MPSCTTRDTRDQPPVGQACRGAVALYFRGSVQRRTASPALVLLALGTVVAVARAELPERAPPECRAQVAAAVSALAPVLRPHCTLERAIRAYAPGRLHAVDEGTLPAVHPNARCPSGMASVGGRFCIDRWEGSLVERRADGTEAPWAPWAAPLDGHVYLARSSPGVVPQGYVSAAQAEAACRASGKRLCAPVEWRAACGGSQAWAYPYGPARQAGKCHDAGAAPMLAFYSDKLRTGWGLREMNDPRLDQMPDTVAKTGAYPACVNDFGVYDMVGNLDEWTADPNGTFQGGFWLDTSLHGEGCAYRTIAHGYRYHDYSTGFRCCAEPR
jgi:sulfatase modifying factor 1